MLDRFPRYLDYRCMERRNVLMNTVFNFLFVSFCGETKGETYLLCQADIWEILSVLETHYSENSFWYMYNLNNDVRQTHYLEFRFTNSSTNIVIIWVLT